MNSFHQTQTFQCSTPSIRADRQTPFHIELCSGQKDKITRILNKSLIFCYLSFKNSPRLLNTVITKTDSVSFRNELSVN